MRAWWRHFRCDIMGWHYEPAAKGFDGVSLNGRCPNCKRRVLCDSQGNWFSVSEQPATEEAGIANMPSKGVDHD